MRLINLGYSPNEISANIDLPPGLWADYHCHGYYGTVSHNVRAVYQRYIGFYDGHPSSLDPYEPVKAGRRYVDFMGGMDQLLARARKSYEAGDHRWVAEVLRHAVFADPTCEEARLLQADAFEQLAYRAEAGPWRDIYLSGAQELRNGSIAVESISRPRPELVTGMDLQQAFDLLAASLDGVAAAAIGPLTADWHLDDVDDTVRLELSNGTLHSLTGSTHASADVVVHGDRSQLNRLFDSDATVASLLDERTVTARGDVDRLRALFACVTEFPRFYNIIEP
jgi:alkyl sulfatase BDS1-like metallo-beta-lactamase superfamily hydrolase